MAFVARRRVGVGPETKTDSHRLGRKSAMVCWGLVGVRSVWGWEGGGVVRCCEIVYFEIFRGWCCFVGGYLTDTVWDVGGSLSVWYRRMGFGRPAIDELN